MSKRSSSALESESNGSRSKKSKSSKESLSEAYTTLLEQADEFISCLQTLKQSKHQPLAPNLQKRLSELSKKLSPALHQISEQSSHAQSSNGQQHNSDDGASRQLEQALPDLRASIPDVFITPWTTSEISSQLPELPRILKPEVEAAVYRHPGLGHGSNYERLEWLGDAYIEMIATNLIFRTFGETPAGRCSQIREQLVRNATLATYFQKYNMGPRAQVPPHFGDMSTARSKEKEIVKIKGDIFEAYVAAVIVSDPSNGLARVAQWLKALWGSEIKDQVKQAEAKKESDQHMDFKDPSATPSKRPPTPKEQLAMVIVVKGILLRYEDMPSSGNKKDKKLNLPLYPVGVYLTGWGEQDKLLGVGSALNKKEAGQKAAAAALENKKLMKLYGDKKKAFQEAQAASGAHGVKT